MFVLITFTGNAWYEEIHWKSFEAVIVLLNISIF